MKRRVTPLLPFLCLLSGIAIGAPPGKASKTDAAPLDPVTSVEGMTEYDLPNGLRVILFPDQTKPTVTVNMTYFVGSRHEGYGETGMAHLLEHMMFKGTPGHPKIWKELEDHGAFFNGTTWTDRTNYYEVMPASAENLAFGIGLEADRMIHSKIAAEDLATEFSVVRNEFEMGENYPTRVLEERMYSSAYLWHNYGKSTIGSRSDIERVPVDNLRAFYAKYYQPDNAMLVVAGKFEAADALALVEKELAKVPRPSRKLSPTYTLEPVQDGERTVTLKRAGDVGAVGVMYHGVAGGDEDFVAEEAIVDLLTAEPSGRLYKALVEKGLASAVYGVAYTWAEPGVMQVMAEVRTDKPLPPVRDTITAVMEGLAREPVTQEEVERFKARSAKDFALAMTDNQRIGIELSEWAALGDWRMFFVHRDRVEGLTSDRVQRVAERYLKTDNRTVGTFVPTKDLDRAPMPPAVDVAGAVNGYKGREAGADAGEFVASFDNIEKLAERSALTSGLKLTMVPKPTRGGAVQVQITLRFGSEQDLKGKSPALNMLPDLLMRGTKKRDYQALKDEMDRLKAQVNMWGGASSATMQITTVKEHLPEVLALAAEVLREPSFPEDQFEILRKETLARLEEQLQDPMSQGFSTLYRKMSPRARDDVRYQPTTAERIAEVKAIPLAALRDHYRQFWGASAGEATVIGDFDAAAVKADLEKGLGSFKSPRPFARITSPYVPGVAASEETIETPDKQMAMVGVGHAFELEDDDPDYPAMEMWNYILGSSAKSRLLDRLRQKEGLSYGAFSNIWASAFERNGTVMAGAICAPQNAKRSLALIQEEIDKLLTEGVTAAELEDAKASYKLQTDNQLAQDEMVVALLGQLAFEGRTFSFQKELCDSVQKLTPEAMASAARRIIDTGRLVKIVAGDIKNAEATATASK
ncbi:MAG: pitrilysin family protein [Acidobacteriota bacterium]